MNCDCSRKALAHIEKLEREAPDFAAEFIAGARSVLRVVESLTVSPIDVDMMPRYLELAPHEFRRGKTVPYRARGVLKGKVVVVDPEWERNRLQCVVPGCIAQRRSRGLCDLCYKMAFRAIKEGITSWARLEAEGKCLRPLAIRGRPVGGRKFREAYFLGKKVFPVHRRRKRLAPELRSDFERAAMDDIVIEASKRKEEKRNRKWERDGYSPRYGELKKKRKKVSDVVTEPAKEKRSPWMDKIENE